MRKEIPMVVGFAVNPDKSRVILIQKNRGPSFNLGLWNGLGGKIMVDEGIRRTMAREFYEEAGAATDPAQWQTFHIEKHLAAPEQDRDPRLYFMTAVLSQEQWDLIRTVESEPVASFALSGWERQVPDLRLYGVYNIGYLLEMVRTWHHRPDRRWIEG